MSGLPIWTLSLLRIYYLSCEARRKRDSNFLLITDALKYQDKLEELKESYELLGFPTGRIERLIYLILKHYENHLRNKIASYKIDGMFIVAEGFIKFREK